MKLSHAFMVVLVLHLIAIGAIVAFTSINTKKAELAGTSTDSRASNRTAAAAPAEKTERAVSKSEPVVEKKAPATVAAPTHAVTKTATATTDAIHTVIAGETLPKIAAANGVTAEALQKENGLSTYSTIKVGQKLKIPHAVKTTEVKKTAPVATTAPKTAAAAAPATPAVKSATAATPDIYEVAKGDNPYSIAKKLKVTYAALLKENSIDDPTKLQIGQKLKIPKAN